MDMDIDQSFSHEQVADSLRQVAKKHNMSVNSVSWEDCSRGWNSNGSLSCMGSNIADVRILDMNKKSIYTVRSENWDEKLAVVAAKDLALIVGNESASVAKNFKAMTLDNYLKNAGLYGKYAGVPSNTSLYSNETDDKVSVRFQTVFIPASKDPQFTTSVYSYATHDAADPQNLLLYCTSQGTSIQQDAPGQEKLFLHMNNPNGSASTHWLKAITSDQKVGQEQVETKESTEKALQQGHAVAQRIGVKHMGNRFNVVMLIQVPLKQVQQSRGFGGYGGNIAIGNSSGGFGYKGSSYKSMAFGSSEGNDGCYFNESASFGSPPVAMACSFGSAPPAYRGVSKGPPPRTGTSVASRVSMGKMEEKEWKGLTCKNFTRHGSQHLTATITMYYLVEGGVPSVADVEAAIADINKLYADCGLVGKLSNLEPLGITDKKSEPFVFQVQNNNPFQPMGDDLPCTPLTVPPVWQQPVMETFK